MFHTEQIPLILISQNAKLATSGEINLSYCVSRGDMQLLRLRHVTARPPGNDSRTYGLLTCRTFLPIVQYVLLLKYFILYYYCDVGPVTQSVQRLTTGWTARDRIPVGTTFSARPDRPWGPPILL